MDTFQRLLEKNTASDVVANIYKKFICLVDKIQMYF